LRIGWRISSTIERRIDRRTDRRTDTEKIEKPEGNERIAQGG
jgi:hypothetical protein